MQQLLVFTFISDDKPGIVERLSQTVTEAGGNWLESRLTKLAGKFAGFVQISTPSDNVSQIENALHKLNDEGIAVLFAEDANASNFESHETLQLNIIGLDRTGIIKELASAFAAHHLNVVSLQSHTESAAMSAEELFKAEVTLDMHSKFDKDKFSDELEDICNELDLDWSLTDA